MSVMFSYHYSLPQANSFRFETISERIFFTRFHAGF